MATELAEAAALAAAITQFSEEVAASEALEKAGEKAAAAAAYSALEQDAATKYRLLQEESAALMTQAQSPTPETWSYQPSCLAS